MEHLLAQKWRWQSMIRLLIIYSFIKSRSNPRKERITYLWNYQSLLLFLYEELLSRQLLNRIMAIRRSTKICQTPWDWKLLSKRTNGGRLSTAYQNWNYPVWECSITINFSSCRLLMYGFQWKRRVCHEISLSNFSRFQELFIKLSPSFLSYGAKPEIPRL